jgi:hypothetical protein
MKALFRFRRRRRLVQIGEVKPTEDMKISGGLLYELNPVNYSGPDLAPGTVLEVVATPEKDQVTPPRSPRASA